MAIFATSGSGVQWGGTINSPQDLAQVIQGESSSPQGQYGVASVIYNRLGSNDNFGQVNGIEGAVTPSQFNGYNPSPSPYAQQLANDLWTGNAPSGGDSTGNALYFAAPRSDNASWANPSTASGQGLFGQGSNNLGGNYFSDQMGAPSSSFQAPDYTGSSSGGNSLSYASDPSAGSSSNTPSSNPFAGILGSTSSVPSAITGAANNIDTTGTGIISSLETFLANAATVTLLAILGVVFVAFGLYTFVRKNT